MTQLFKFLQLQTSKVIKLHTPLRVRDKVNYTDAQRLMKMPNNWGFDKNGKDVLSRFSYYTVVGVVLLYMMFAEKIIGTKNIVVLLWQIPDNSRSELIVKFYGQLEQNLDKVKILRQAILETMKQQQYWVYWAAFKVVGEAE